MFAQRNGVFNPSALPAVTLDVGQPGVGSPGSQPQLSGAGDPREASWT